MTQSPDWEELAKKIRADSPTELENLTADMVKERALKLGTSLKVMHDKGKGLRRRDAQHVDFAVYHADPTDDDVWEQACFDTACEIELNDEPPGQAYFYIQGNDMRPIGFALTDLVSPLEDPSLIVTAAQARGRTEPPSYQDINWGAGRNS